MSQRRVEGVGIGLRHDLAQELLRTAPAEVRWLEIHPENDVRRGGRFEQNLEQAGERWPIVPHGLSLGFGNVDPYDPAYVGQLKALLDRTGAGWYSDHLCFAVVDGTFLHDLLPIPFREDAVLHVAGRVRELADRLERPVAVENVSYYADPAAPRMREWDFVGEVLERADCKLLLDVNNVYVNSRNHSFDPRRYIDAMPRERVVQIHVAGHLTRKDGLIIDTHGEPICEGVYDLLGYTLERLGPVPVLLERDANIPALDEVLDEVRRLTAIYERSVRAFEAKRSRGASASAS